MNLNKVQLKEFRTTTVLIAVIEAIELIAASPVYAENQADSLFQDHSGQNAPWVEGSADVISTEQNWKNSVFADELAYPGSPQGGGVLLGRKVYHNSRGSIAVGLAAASVDCSTVFGNNVLAQNHSIVFGVGSRAKNYSSSFGIGTRAEGLYSLGLGNYAKATNPYSVSLGAFSEDESTSSNIGWNPLTDKTNLAGAAWTPLGGGSFSENSVISIGRSQQGGDPSTAITRRIVNLAAGEKDTDAVNVAQLKTVYNAIAPIAENAGKAGEYLSVNDSSSVSSQTTSAKASGPYATAIGISSSATGENSLSIGRQSFAEGKDSIALGSGSKIHSSDLIAADTNGVLSIGSSDAAGGFNRRIINVADGIKGNDAATVGQAQTFANSTAKIALSNVLGTSVKEQNGTFSTGDIGGTGQTTVSGAISSVKDSIKNLYNDGTFSTDAQS